MSRVGPFGSVIRPSTVTGDDARSFVNVNALLGFEVSDVRTGKRLDRVEVPGYALGPVRSHSCPIHALSHALATASR